MKWQKILSSFFKQKRMAVESEKHEDGLDNDGAAGEVSLIKPHLHGRNFLARLGWKWYVYQKNSSDYSFTRYFFYRAKWCEIMIWYG